MMSGILEVYEESMKLLQEISNEFKLSTSELEKARKIIKEYLSNSRVTKTPNADNLVIAVVSLLRGDLQTKLIKKFNKPSSTISSLKSRIKERIDLSRILNNSCNSSDIDKIINKLEKIDDEIKELINELKYLNI